MVCKVVDVPLHLAVDIIAERASPDRLPNFSMPETLLICGALIIGSWISISAAVRRYHDQNKTGWWLLIVLVPYIGQLWQTIELGFFSGTPSGNDYDVQERSGSSSRNYDAYETRIDSLDGMIQQRLAKRQRQNAAVLQRDAPLVERNNPPANDRPVFGRRV